MKDRETFAIIEVSERDYVRHSADVPDASSSFYTTTTVNKNADESESHVLSGMRLVFDKRERDAGSLFNRYRPRTEHYSASPKDKIRDLTICADELVIYGDLWLPETDVRVFARRLVFREQEGSPGRIITSPLPHACEKALIKMDGVRGAKAGDISVCIGDLETDRDPATHFCLHGGKGQSAGEGTNGPDGEVLKEGKDYVRATKWIGYALKFDPPAIEYTASYYSASYAGRGGGLIENTDSTRFGRASAWPENGKDATSPGKPGQGGAGGNFFGVAPFAALRKHGFPAGGEKTREAGSEVCALPGLVDAAGGAAGGKAQDTIGGKAGEPKKTARYKINISQRGYGGPKVAQSIVEQKESQAGKSIAAPEADAPGGGADGECHTKSSEEVGNAWVHPAVLQVFQRYVRDAFVMAPEKVEKLTPLIGEYIAALRHPPTEELRNALAAKGKTGEPRCCFSDAICQQALAEAVLLLNRLENHLDYFGNPLGWAPLFSLPACFALYKEEVSSCLKDLVIATWIQQKAGKAQEAIGIAQQAIESLDKDTKGALDEIGQEEKNWKELDKKAANLLASVQRVARDMHSKQMELLGKAEEEAERKAAIRFLIGLASAVCQVIPYGQPALGAAANAGKEIIDKVVLSDEPVDPVKIVEPLTVMVSKVTSAKLGDKAAELIAAANEEKKEAKVQEAEAAAAKLTHVGNAIGPALADVVESMKGLHVPRGEVEAILKRLEAESPEFQKMAADLKELNEEKERFVELLAQCVHAMTSAYSRISSNLQAAGSMEREQRADLTVLDHDALLFVRKMDQNARFRLVKYLYYLAKSYEYTSLEPIDVNSRLDEVFDKLAPLLTEKSIDTDGLGLVEKMTPLFMGELKALADKLRSGFRIEKSFPLHLRLSMDETREIMTRLNADKEVRINMMASNGVLPSWEKARIEDVEVVINFRKSGPDLPKSGTVWLTVEPVGEGTMRVGEALYVVRHPASEGSAPEDVGARQSWVVTHDFVTGKTHQVHPSKGCMDLLNSLTGGADASVQSLALPAAWTDIKIQYGGYMMEPPEIESVDLLWSIAYTPANDRLRVLDLRMGGTDAPLLTFSRPDEGGRKDGYGALYRIYNKGTNGLEITAPPDYGRKRFSHWVVYRDTMDVKDANRTVEASNSLKIDEIKHNMLVECVYEELVEALAPLETASPAGARTRGPALVGDRRLARAGITSTGAKHQGKLLPGWSASIFGEPGLSTVGYLSPGATFTSLGDSKRVGGIAWQAIDFRGTVGWIPAEAIERGLGGQEGVPIQCPATDG